MDVAEASGETTGSGAEARPGPDPSCRAKEATASDASRTADAVEAASAAPASAPDEAAAATAGPAA